jgi:hypothetical protein
MVNFVTYITVLLAAVSSAVAIPYTLQERQSDTTCMDHLPASSLARVRSNHFVHNHGTYH